MRIGILTLPPHTNYGGILQAYALQTVLERMGNKVEVIGAPVWKPYLPLWRRILSISKRFCLHYFFCKKNVIIDRVNEGYKLILASRKFTSIFVSKYIHIRKVRCLHDIRPNDYDAIVVGSDQIWRTKYNHQWKGQKDDDVFLGFTKGWNIKRIAYAASFGIDQTDIKSEKIESCKEAIARFNSISVREKTGIGICKKVFGVDSVLMPDPTLLLSRDDYQKLIPIIHSRTKNPILLSYILDDNVNKSRLRERIAKEKGLKIKITNKSDYKDKNGHFFPQPPVEDWLKAFAECEYVITDSFHACVFSIIFHKQFTVIANRERGISRFLTLLGMFGLEDRMINSTSEYHPLDDIDYSKVDSMLNERKKDAIKFLKTNLNE